MNPSTNPHMNDAAAPYFEDADSKPVPDLPTVSRNAINAIIYYVPTGEVLCLDWMKFKWKTFVIGGIEDSEDPVAAALREIHEETGYKNLKFIAELGKTRSSYYAAHKHENRMSNAVGLLFQLLDTERDLVPASETATHVVTWIPKGHVASYITLSSQRYLWEKAQALLEQIEQAPQTTGRELRKDMGSMKN